MRRLLPLLLVVSCAAPAPAYSAPRCSRYVGVRQPCVGLAGPVTRVVAGRACVARLPGVRAELAACRALRTNDAGLAAARLDSAHAALARCRARPSVTVQPVRRPAWQAFAVWALVGAAAGAVAARALSCRWRSRGCALR